MAGLQAVWEHLRRVGRTLLPPCAWLIPKLLKGIVMGHPCVFAPCFIRENESV